MLCPNLRAFWSIALAALMLAVPSPVARAADRVEWLTDRQAALTQARKQGKLLLVVHLSADFTGDPLAADEAKLYRTTALADQRVAEVLTKRYVVLVRAIGETSTLRLNRKDKAAAQDCAMTYFCLPDERVLHFMPGFLSADELLAELTWVERTYAKLATYSAGEQPAYLRQAHQAAIARADLSDFVRRFPSRWTGEELLAGDSTVDLPAVTAAARGTFEAALAKRLGPQWRRDASTGGLAALAAHGSIGGELAHLILSEFPLAALGDLARPAYAACSGRRLFTANPRRRAELAAWWVLNAKANRPSLLVVADDDFYGSISKTASDDPFGQQPWPPENPGVIPGLSRLATQVVTLDELSLLLADAKLPEVFLARDRPLRYLVHDGQGFRIAELAGPDALYGQLASAIKELVGLGAASPLEATAPPVSGGNNKAGTRGASARRSKP